VARNRVSCLTIYLGIAAGYLCIAAGFATAQTPAAASFHDESEGFRTETVLSNLDNPFGLAVRLHQTKPRELFVAESGAGRVIRITIGKPSELVEAITDFEVATLAIDGSRRGGPLGLAFLTRSKLIVGDCANRVLRVFALPKDGATLTAADADHMVGPPRIGKNSNGAKLDFLSLAVANQLVYISSRGHDGRGWILQAGGEANRLSYLRSLIDMRQTASGLPGGIAVIPSPRPPFLVVAQSGVSGCSLTFLIPTTGEQAMSLSTGLSDVLSLAYSPSGQLYAADFSPKAPEAGGIYRLDDARVEGRPACRAVKIATIARPVAMVFTSEETLYVTSFGEGQNAKQGKLIKITGNF